MAARGPNPAPETILVWPFDNFTKQKGIGQWCSFGPQTCIFELSLALYGLPKKIIENPCHILLKAMLYFDRIIQDLKLTKQKYVYK